MASEWGGGVVNVEVLLLRSLSTRREQGYPSLATRPASMNSSRVERCSLTYLPSLM